jgi:NTP pyrophosphatase (non-canonical NTP hydrolase)
MKISDKETALIKDFKEFCYSGFMENPMNDKILDYANMVIGIMEESVEILEVVMQAKHSNLLSNEDYKERIKSEMGDFLWYFMNFLTLSNQKFEELELVNHMEGIEIITLCEVGVVNSSKILGELKRMMFHSKEVLPEEITKLAGFQVSYFFDLLKAHDFNLEDIIEANKNKLRNRYPNGRGKNYQLRKDEGNRIKELKIFHT